VKRFGIFGVSAVAITVVLVGVGAGPVRKWVGSAGPTAFGAGCVIGLVAALLGAVVVILGEGRAQAIVLAFGAMGVRLAVIVLCGAALLFGSSLPRQPLLLGIGISYLALLPLETWFLLKGSAAQGSG